MVPTIEHYVISGLRAMSEVVLPAIDPSDTLALEQAQLVIGVLTLISEQWDKTLALEHAELREHVRLASDLLQNAEGGVQTSEAARRAAALVQEFMPLSAASVPTHARLHEANRHLRHATQQLIAAASADGSTAFRTSSTRTVLDYAQRQNLRSRAWFAGSHLDASWNTLPSIDQTLT